MSLATTEVINPITSATTTLLAPDNVKRKLSESPSELKTVKKCKTDVNTAFIEQTDETIADAIAELIELAPNDASEKNGPNLVSSADVVVEAEENEEVNHPEVIVCPKYGQLVNRREFRRAGPYIIGLKLGHSPVDSIVQYLAKKENTNQFVQLKILMLNNNTTNEKLLQDERQGKMLLHTEFSLLSLLKNQPGVIQQHGMFSDMAYEEVMADNFSNNNFYTGATRKRLILVLDCVTPHDFDPNSSAYINLQQHLINRKKLTEMEALKIFYEIVSVVESLHKRNIIHRDLKLGNIVLNKHSNKIKIINFCLGKYLLNENDLLHDQRGSPAYISPDVLCGKPYKGKPSDMWALGVVLFMMLYRQFPFFESTPTALFKKIKQAEYFIPLNCEVSNEAEHIVKELLQLNPEHRLTATQVREKLKAIIDSNASVQDVDRIVPQIPFNDDEAMASSFGDAVSIRDKSRSSLRNNARDQVVPTMSPPVTEQPTSRKRRRSTDTVSGPSIHQRPTLPILRVGSDARQLGPSDIEHLQRLFQRNRNRIEDIASRRNSPFASPQTSPTTPTNIFSVLNRVNLQLSSNSQTPQNRTPTSTSNRTQATVRRPITVETNGSSSNSTQQAQGNNSNRSTFSQLLTLDQFYRCALTSRRGGTPTQQSSLSSSRQEAEIRHLMRRARRSRSSTSNNSSRR